METKEFLLKHPLISPSSIERVLEIPTGTIRLSNPRPIPVKYDALIRMLLSDYGWNNDVKELDKPIITNVKESDNAHLMPKNKQEYFIKRIGNDSIVYYNDGLNKRANIPDLTKIIILDPSL